MKQLLVQFKNTFLSYKYLILILGIFFVLYSLISLVNHYFFRTAAFDLGGFNHVLYNMAHFNSPISTLYFTDFETYFLGDHFSPILYLFAPLYYVFGSYTLLIVQIVSILFGGIGIYKYVELTNKGGFFKYFHVLHFLGIWGIFSAVAYDFHSNVVGAMLIPWLFYHYKKGNVIQLIIYTILILICKENMSLWLAFIFLGLMFNDFPNRKLKSIATLEFPLFIISILYFVVVVVFIMPHLINEHQSAQILRYQYLGNSFTEIISTLFHDPRYTFSLLFEIQSTHLEHIGIKSETLFMLLVSGGFVFFRYPQYLIMIIPIYAQKMLAIDWFFWGINGQYSIEFVPIIAIAVVDFVQKFPHQQYKKWLLIGIVLLTYYFNGSSLDHRKSEWYNKKNSAFFSSSHYKSNLNIAEIHKALQLVPNNVTVSSGSTISPYLSNRQKLYHFPRIGDAQYIVVFSSNIETYPLTKEEFELKINELKSGGNWIVEYDLNDLIILRKK